MQKDRNDGIKFNLKWNQFLKETVPRVNSRSKIQRVQGNMAGTTSLLLSFINFQIRVQFIHMN